MRNFLAAVGVFVSAACAQNKPDNEAARYCCEVNTYRFDDATADRTITMLPGDGLRVDDTWPLDARLCFPEGCLTVREARHYIACSSTSVVPFITAQETGVVYSCP